jgi:hypothetical protein
MRLKKSALRRIIRESLKGEMDAAHVTENIKAIQGLMSIASLFMGPEDQDDLLIEPDADEDDLEEALAGFDPGGMPERSHISQDPDAYADHPDYRAGSKDADEGVTPPEDPSEEYMSGYDSARQEW